MFLIFIEKARLKVSSNPSYPHDLATSRRICMELGMNTMHIEAPELSYFYFHIINN
jgi:hypothetical protein